MANLPPALDFAKTEEEICEKWAKEDTFKTQDRLSLERGDEVRIIIMYHLCTETLVGGFIDRIQNDAAVWQINYMISRCNICTAA